MADNVEANAGSGGATFATDEISSVHYPRSKLALGADGSATDALGGAGAVAAGVQRVTLASDDPAVTALQLLDNAISGSEMQVDIVSSALPTGAATAANQSTIIGHVDGIEALLTTIDADTDAIKTAVEIIDNAISGSEMQVDVVGSLPAGASLVGDVGLSGARTSGGTTLYKNIDVDESEDQVKGTAGQVYWIHAMNLGSATRFLKLYNATAASVTVGTTVPDLTFPLPTQGDTNGAGFVLTIPNGIAFGTAITIAATTGVADNDSGAPGANEVIVNLGYA